jgi:hypothetical protein
MPVTAEVAKAREEARLRKQNSFGKGALMPAGNDGPTPINLESLGDAEFAKAVGCSREEFEELPKWKQKELTKVISAV